MGKYGDVAVLATDFVKKKQAQTAVEAWDLSVKQIFSGRYASQKKGCPRGAYLGLCEEGLVKGVPRGSYTKSILNKKYALDAVSILQKEPNLRLGAQIWKRIMKGRKKTENGQMDVVLDLWVKGLISCQKGLRRNVP